MSEPSPRPSRRANPLLVAAAAIGGAVGMGYLVERQRRQSAATGSSLTADATSVFHDIYSGRVWGSNESGSGHSGSGSTMAATTVYRAFLQSFLAEHEITSVVDAGCGDWEFSQAIDWSGIDYKGFDAVEAVVEANREKYEADNVHFFHADVVDHDLPPADLLLCKNVLQHLTDDRVHEFLRNHLHKYPHVLLTNGVRTHNLTAKNRKIEMGGYRPLDMTRPPFNVDGLKILTYHDGSHMQQVVYVTPQAATA